jgi:hypothetical protein
VLSKNRNAHVLDTCLYSSLLGMNAKEVLMAPSSVLCRCNVLPARSHHLTLTHRPVRGNIKPRCTYATKAAAAEVRSQAGVFLLKSCAIDTGSRFSVTTGEVT